MKRRAKKLLAYILVTLLVLQLAGDNVLNLLAEEYMIATDITVNENSSDDYIFSSGGATLTIAEGVTVSGKVDFTQTTQSNTLENNGTITGNIITGNSYADIYNNGIISSGSFNLKSGCMFINTGTTSSITMEGGDAEINGGRVGTITDIVGSYIVLRDCTIGTLSSPKTVYVNGTIHATSLSTRSITSEGGSATVEVSDYVKASEGIKDVKVVVQKATVIDASDGSGYSVFYNDKEYVMSAGSNGTIVDSHGKKVVVSQPDSSHLTINGSSDTIAYLPGETADLITLTPEEGYYFPEDYCNNIATDGAGSLTATRVSEEEVTISYILAETETKDVTITLASASLKPKAQGIGSIEIEDMYYGAELEVVLASDTNDIESAKVEYKKKGTANNQYRTKKPTDVGAYTARVTYAENKNYTSCTATTDFNIRYLPIPDDAYVIQGDKGDNGFYISKVEIIPAQGYSVAKKLDGTYKESLVFISSQDSVKAYFQKDETGEKTKGVKLPEFKIDFVPPTMSVTHGYIYYGKSITVDISDENLNRVTCNQVNMTFEDESAQLILDSNHGSSDYRIYAEDLAGNSRQIEITVADEWLKKGFIPANQLVRLSPNTVYQLQSGTWKVAGDTTQYKGGQSFYVRSEGEYTFGN